MLSDAAAGICIPADQKFRISMTGYSPILNSYDYNIIIEWLSCVW